MKASVSRSTGTRKRNSGAKAATMMWWPMPDFLRQARNPA